MFAMGNPVFQKSSEDRQSLKKNHDSTIENTDSYLLSENLSREFDIKQLADSSHVICGDSIQIDIEGLLFYIDKNGNPMNTRTYYSPLNNIL